MMVPMDADDADSLGGAASERIWGVARFGDDLSEVDRRLADALTPVQRLDATLQLSLAAWRLKHGDEPPPRLRGSAWGVR